MKQSIEVGSLRSSSCSGDDSEKSSGSESEDNKFGRRVKGIAVKHLESIPFSSTICAFLDLHEISAPLSRKESRKFRGQMETEVKSLSIHLCCAFGLFEWEKETLGIANRNTSTDYQIRASFTPTFDLHKKLKCLMHLQIKLKLKRFQKEVEAMNKVMLGNWLPLKESILRKNLLIDLAMILQHQVKVTILGIDQEKHARVEPFRTPVSLPLQSSSIEENQESPVIQHLKGWKSLLTLRDISFENGENGHLHSCIILPFDSSSKGFVLARKCEDQLIPLLWAKPKIGSGFDIYEAKEEKNLLGIVKLNSFGADVIVYERFKYGDLEFLKEIAAINYPNILRRKTGLELTILLGHLKDLGLKDHSSKSSTNFPKSMSLRRKWKSTSCGMSGSADSEIDFHVLKIRKPSHLDGSGEKSRGRIQMEVQDESGDILLRMGKLMGRKYFLEYKRPFDAFTAFSSVLSKL